MGSGWNFADVFEDIARRLPDAPALVQGERTVTWAQFDRRADGLAAHLVSAGASHGDKVAQYLHNAPEYLEALFACFKASLVPVNTNYRYGDDELAYLWDNADAVAVVFHGAFTATVERLRHRLGRIAVWVHVDDGTGPCPPWATPYERAVATEPADRPVVTPPGRSGDDLLFMYTGGTTGMPKGVMWRQDDLLMQFDATSKRPLPAEPTAEGWALLAERTAKPGPRAVPAAPLMHGTGQFNALSVLMAAGCIVVPEHHRFDPDELLATVERHRANSICIVGDAFAKPILRALDAAPGRYDLSSLKVVVSSGVMFSAETKAGLLRHLPRLTIVDMLGSSEAVGMANNVTTSSSSAGTATFTVGPTTRVLDEEGRDVVPGSGQRGLVALRGRVPVGYYKDPVKSAATFRVIDGVRYSIPGDWAEVDADGTVRLLGRGSQCINTGGEKVYPEEVEEVLKTHPSVADAAVVGVPDERFGEAVAALVEPHAGGTIDEAELIAHVRARLAHYKAPRRVFAVDAIGRAPNGKLDYRRLKAEAISQLG